MDAQVVNERTIFLMLSGSRAHGTHREDSDYDKTGVMIPPPKYFFGLDRVDHFRKFEGEDKVIYDFRKAICLLNDNNPNILDLLFSPERCTLILKEPWKKMLEHRDLFISRKCRNTYSGYAYAQLSRIETHRRFLLDPPKIKPERKDFGLPEFSIFPTAQIKGVIFAALGDFIIEEDKEDLLVELEDVYSNYIIPIFSRHIKPDLQALAMKYLHVGMKSQANTLKALGPSFIKDEYLEMATNELRFYCADAKWQQYQAWLKNRNKARAELERKFGYDCYADDTEFLTDQGWKKYDDIDNTMHLATLKLDDLTYKLCTKSLIGEGYRADYYVERFGIEYQPYVDRFEGTYSGVMYNFIGNHMDILVTPNHRMLFRPVGKNTGVEGDFVLEEASILPNFFDFIRAVTPQKKIYKNPEELSDLPIKTTQYLSLMGWYLSEGCVNKNKSGIIKCLRISQKKDGRLSWYFTRFYNQVKDKISCKIYTYKRKPNKYRPYEIEEMNLIVSDKDIRERIYNDCGHLTAKRIPRWIFGLSKRLMDVLLTALCLGDGTIHNTSFRSLIYYSTLRGLADDVQELALCCGYETSLYGPYEDEKDGKILIMYQVHINKSTTQFDRLDRSKNLRKLEVENKRIVCFTVLNRTLITRRNGHVAFHGNSKHAAHLVRLIRMCKEILETGKINVDRTNIDAEELKAIRYEGIWKYQDIVEYAMKIDKECGELYKTSTLQLSPDFEKIKALCESICADFIKKEI